MLPKDETRHGETQRRVSCGGGAPAASIPPLPTSGWRCHHLGLNQADCAVFLTDIIALVAGKGKVRLRLKMAEGIIKVFCLGSLSEL